MFALEKDMTAPAEQWLALRTTLTKREVPLPWGICDLVGCELVPLRVARRISEKHVTVIAPQLRVSLLSEIAREPGTQAEVSARLWMREEVAERHLSDMVKRRVLSVDDSGVYTVSAAWFPVHSRLITLELKLSRASAVFAQAVGHLECATESWVGMPLAVAERAVVSEVAKEYIGKGVGILGISPKDCIELVAARATRADAGNRIQIYVAERFWKMLRKQCGR